MTDWVKLAKSSYDASTSYLDTNYRKTWDADIRAFHSQHPQGSKYLSDSFKYRSRGFRPRTRTIIRKNEAAASIALFSNRDVTNIDAVDQDDVMSVANAAIGKELLQHRLTKTIPWYKLSLGAFQEAMALGVVCSYQYWTFDAETQTVDVPGAMDEDGEQATTDQVNILEDAPCIELRPIENLRFHPSADWLDPVNKSPYFIDRIPMFVGEVKRMASQKIQKTGEPKWLKLTDAELSRGVGDEYDSTRTQREPGREDRMEGDGSDITDFDTVWVHRNFMRVNGKDMVFYTLKTFDLLSEPKFVSEVYPHLERNKRPYVMGICVIEAQRPIPGGLARLAAPLQTEANEISNERRDNVKLVLNKRYKVARGKQVDVDGLLRNAPGSVVLMNDVNMDVQEMSWPDVTQSAYVEQDRINADLDELVGNFSGSTRQANTAMNETLGGAKLGQQSESMMQEYVLRTWVESWCEPVLRQLLALEQEYESDETVVALCAKKAQLWQKFGISTVTDDLLRKAITLTVNVGMGATDPDARLKRFLDATMAALKLAGEAPPGFNVPEAIKEIYSLAGMSEGERFFPENANPQLQKAMQAIQQLQQKLQQAESGNQAKAQIAMAQTQSAERIKSAEIQVDAQRIKGDLQLRAQELAIQQKTLDLESAKLNAAGLGKTLEHQARVADMQKAINESSRTLQLDREKFSQQDATARWKTQQDNDRAVTVAQISAKSALDTTLASAEQRANADISTGSEGDGTLAKLLKLHQDTASKVDDLGKQIASPKPKLVSVKIKKTADGTPVGTLATYDNGETREVAVGT